MAKMNVFRLSPTILTLNAWNLAVNLKDEDGGLSGHYKIFYHVPTENILVYFKGGFGGLLWYPENKDADFIHELSERSMSYLLDYAKKEIENRSIFDYRWKEESEATDPDLVREYQITCKAVAILSKLD
jgi:hypothetical protein